MEAAAGGRNIMLATGGAAGPPSIRNANVRWIFSTSLTESELRAYARPRALAPGSARLITVARQENGKGTDLLIRSLPRILARFPEARADVVGEGAALRELKELADGLGVGGRVAFHEPGLMGREVYFTVRSHGYEHKKDGFGFAGAKVTPKAGRVAEIKVTRRNVAERLCRLTGEGRYRDTALLGHAVPVADAAHPGQVAGQDSVQAVPYRDRVYWFWGDTQRLSYPLGLFRTAGARCRSIGGAIAGWRRK